jgi:sarcosine oxidase subunit delta
MIINCPHCGPRDLAEFSYAGDATLKRPDPASTDRDAWNAYVYDRENPAGKHREHWQHASGCRRFLIVTRSTLTHEISDVKLASGTPAKGRRK